MKRSALSLAAALALAAPALATGASSGLAVVPPTIDLGLVETATTVDARVWLVNTSRQPIEVGSSKPSCGCTTVAFEPVTLAPGAAHPVRFSIETPKKDDKSKTAAITFTPTWGDPVEAGISLRTTRAGAAAPAPAISDPAPVVLVPDDADLGSVERGAPIDTSAWLINGSPASVRVRGIKAGCGCTTVVAFEPTDLAPSSAVRVRLRTVPRKLGEAKSIALTAHLENRAEPLRATVTMSVVAPSRVTAR